MVMTDNADVPFDDDDFEDEEELYDAIDEEDESEGQIIEVDDDEVVDTMLDDTALNQEVEAAGGIDWDMDALSNLMAKDLKQATETLGVWESRYLTDEYYTMQDIRIRAAGQIRSRDKMRKEAGDDPAEPHRIVVYMLERSGRLERMLQAVLGHSASKYNVGRWMQAQHGIGPVLSAAMLSNFRVYLPETKKRKQDKIIKTCAGFWRFAGMDPTVKWNKGERRPWNARLKSICLGRMGPCFVRTWKSDKSVYGKFYKQHKDNYEYLNKKGKYKAAAKIGAERVRKSTDAYKWYKKGLLPPDHINRRSIRKAVKLFTSHLHEMMYEDMFGEKPPNPWIFTDPNPDDPGDPRHAKHIHRIEPPHPEACSGGKSLRELHPVPPEDKKRRRKK